MKRLFATALAAFFALPVGAFEKHELDLGEGEYNSETELTAYQVFDGQCFATYDEHAAYIEAKGLIFESQFRIDPLRVIVVFRNDDTTYREVYLVTAGIGGCLKAVAYAEGEAL